MLCLIVGQRGRPRHPDILTPREWEVLALLRRGLSNEEIAASLGVALSTARFHVSEILGKLGVSSREEAARWRPAEPPAPERRFALAAPLVLLRRLHLASGFGAAAITAAVAGIALLAWGIVATRGSSATKGSASWAIDAASGSEKSDVMLFDLTNRHARRLPMADVARDARWLKPGTTFLAAGGASGDDYSIFGLDGQRVLGPLLLGKLTRDVVPAPGGSALLVGRTDNQYGISELPNGTGSTFLTSARDLAFSPDGKHVAWTGLSNLDQEGNIHKGRVIYVGTANSLTGYTGGGMAIAQDFEDTSILDLAPDPWTPGSKYLLIERSAPCPAGNCQGSLSFEAYATTGASFQRVWSAYSNRLSDAQWAGPDRLFVTFAGGAARDPAYPSARSLLVTFGGDKAPLPDAIEASCCVSFSPDGNYAVARVGADAGERCALFDVLARWKELASLHPDTADRNAAFCASASWTPDGTHVLVSAGSGR